MGFFAGFLDADLVDVPDFDFVVEREAEDFVVDVFDEVFPFAGVFFFPVLAAIDFTSPQRLMESRMVTAPTTQQ